VYEVEDLNAQSGQGSNVGKLNESAEKHIEPFVMGEVEDLCLALGRLRH